MNITSIAGQYFCSANKIKERIDELKESLKLKKFEEQKNIEDRIIVLTAEYIHLVNTANMLSKYYIKQKPVSKKEVVGY